MENYCGANCQNCPKKAICKGCVATCGKPFGGTCIAAEYIKVAGKEMFNQFKQTIMDELNNLKIEAMPEVKELFLLNGSYVNLSYPLTNGTSVKFLNDNDVYLGCQLPSLFSDSENERCFGCVASTGFLLVVQYGENGRDPEIVVYKRR